MRLFWTTQGLMPRRPGGLPVLVLMTDLRLADPCAAAQRLPRGSWVVFRWPHDRPLPAWLGDLRRLCRRRGLCFLVSSDHRLAEKVGADGLHLPKNFARHAILSPALAWKRQSAKRLLSMSAHDASALARANQLGVDAVFLSPVFATASHPGAAALGIHAFARLQSLARCPVIALGGITRITARRLSHSNAGGFACVSALEN